MKCHFLKGVPFVLLSAFFVLWPIRARADFMYAFSGQDANNISTLYNFSFTEPSLLTTTQSFPVSFTLGSVSFTNGDFIAGSNPCFAFSTAPISSCTSGTNHSFFAVFPGATAVGTYSILSGGCTNPGPCPFLSSLTISNTNSPVPEPSGLLLLGSGVLAVAGMVKRRLS